MKRAKRSADAKEMTRSEDEILASMRKNLRSLSCLLGEEVNEEEFLKLNAAEMEDWLMGMLQRVKAKGAAEIAERLVAGEGKQQGKKVRRDSKV